MTFTTIDEIIEHYSKPKEDKPVAAPVSLGDSVETKEIKGGNHETR